MTDPLVEMNIAGIVVGQSVKALPYIASHTSNGDMLDAPACLHSMGQYYYKLATSVTLIHKHKHKKLTYCSFYDLA